MHVYPNEEQTISEYTDRIVAASGSKLLQMYSYHGSEDAMSFANKALSAMGFRSGVRRLLDVGCGACGFLNAVEAILPVPAEKLCGLNLHTCQLKYASPGIETVVGDAQSMPYADNSFNAVTMMYTLGHMPDPQKALSEVARVLVSGGEFLYWDIVRTDSGCTEHLNYQLFKKSDVTRMASEAGLRLVWEDEEIGSKFSQVFKKITSKEERRVCRRVAQPVLMVMEKFDGRS